MVGIGREDESGRHEKLKEDGKSERYAAHIFTTINASLSLKVSAQASTLPILIHEADYNFHEINSVSSVCQVILKASLWYYCHVNFVSFMIILSDVFLRKF